MAIELEGEARINARIDTMRLDVCGHLHKHEIDLQAVNAKVDKMQAETELQTKLLRSLEETSTQAFDAGRRFLNHPVVKYTIMALVAFVGSVVGVSKAQEGGGPGLTALERDLAACGQSAYCAASVRERHGRGPLPLVPPPPAPPDAY